MLEVKNLNVAYEKTQVIWDASFEIRSGEVVALIGPNGAGKTTILKTLMGLLTPLSGSISYMGKDLLSYPNYERPKLGLSLVPEGRRLFPKLTVLENLQITVRTPEAKEKKKETMDWIFELLPKLAERKNQLAGTLSGGEQQMLAIARGILSKPRLLMLDEPSLGLAPIIVEQIFDILGELKKRGLTIFLVEQYVEKSLLLADRAYLLEEGRIVLEEDSKNMLKNDHIRKVYLGI
ncbi:MAG TPA: ABC transporter ATP-binding protein [Clostridiales bacterium]|nr:ABC transporter ATP-binding protein [Clostridiales bacterium]